MQPDEAPPERWRTSRLAAKRAEIARTRAVLASYRQQQDEHRHVLRAARASLLCKQAEELRRQRTASEPESGDGASCLDACTTLPASSNFHGFGFAGAPAPTFHLHPTQDYPAQDLIKFLYESGLSKQDVDGLLLHSSDHAELHSRANQTPSSCGVRQEDSPPESCEQPVQPVDPACSYKPGASSEPASPVPTPNSSEQQLDLPPPPLSDPRASLLVLAERQINAWEVRRLLACRDCLPASLLQRWCLALRVPIEEILGADARAAGSDAAQAHKTVASLVQQSRQYLLLRVHPDKNSPLESRLAAAAFTFLQEASEGLQARLAC